MVLKKDTAVIKKLVMIAMILAVITVSIIAFIGIYTRNVNSMSNIIPNYTLGTEFEGLREYEFEIDKSEAQKDVFVDKNGKVSGEVISDNSSSSDVDVTVEGQEGQVVEENEVEGYSKENRTIKANEDDVLTPDSYKSSKSIVEKRLEELGVAEYNVRLDEENGKLVVEIPDNEESNFVYEVISSQGKFSIIDAQNGLELMDNSNIKKASINYGSENGNYKVYLQLQFDKNGAEKLKEISNNYVEKE